MIVEITRSLKEKAHTFEDEAHQILSKNESAQSRIVSLDRTRSRIKILSLQQDELFQQALACIEREIFRAAHVMAWAGFMDFLEQKLSSDGLVKIKLVRTGWNQYITVEEIRENVPEFQLIEAAHDLRLFSKSEKKILLGLLSKRNECAHPSIYKPGLNESLGYVSELLNRIEQLHPKSL